MRLSLIAAVAENGVIGRGDELPWHLPADLARFKRLTMEHHLILGRRTFATIGRPLPGRTMVVVSRREPELPEGVQLASSIEAALDVARSAGDPEPFVAGGAEIYRQTLPLADRLYLTRVHAIVEGDAHFPIFNETGWRVVDRQEKAPDHKNAHAMTFLTLDRAAAGDEDFRRKHAGAD